jgi:hypothetical protein
MLLPCLVLVLLLLFRLDLSSLMLAVNIHINQMFDAIHAFCGVFLSLNSIFTIYQSYKCTSVCVASQSQGHSPCVVSCCRQPPGYCHFLGRCSDSNAHHSDWSCLLRLVPTTQSNHVQGIVFRTTQVCMQLMLHYT